MPYIEKVDRHYIDPAISEAANFIETAGELNYAITQLCTHYMANTKGKYSDYNTVVGVLECAKQEFYRRAVTPYEDEKIEQNGDVYV